MRAQPEASVSGDARLTIGTAIDQYLDYVQVHRSLRTFRTYRYTLATLLRASYRKPYVDEVTRDDILQFMTDCYRLGLETARFTTWRCRSAY